MGRTELRRSNQAARDLFRPLPKRYDLLAELLSFGQNRRWRRRMIDEVAVAAPRTILDVATGTAGVAEQLAVRTDADVIGVDITEEMLRLGWERRTGQLRGNVLPCRPHRNRFPRFRLRRGLPSLRSLGGDRLAGGERVPRDARPQGTLQARLFFKLTTRTAGALEPR
jgi:SAM-dependent methyltransferase